MISTRETTILLRGEDILGVAIEGGKERTITVSDQSVITASVKSFCGNSEQITYAWRLVSSQPPVEPGVIDFDSIINASLQPQQLVINPGSLLANYSFKFSIIVTEEDTDTEGVDSVDIIVISTPLIIDIDREDGQISLQNDLTLSADRSSDPDNLDGDIEFLWTCEGCNFASDYVFTATEGEAVTISKANLLNGQTYNFVLSGTKGVRTGSDTVTLDVIEWEAPDVNIGYVADVVNPQHDLSIITSTTSENVEYSWSISPSSATFKSITNP